MIQRFHGLDRHKKHSTISVLNREGQEVEFVSKCPDLRGYVEQLGPEDMVYSSGGYRPSKGLRFFTKDPAEGSFVHRAA